MEGRLKILMCGNHPSNKGGMTTVINHIKEYDWEKRNIELNFIPIYYPSNIIIMIFYYLVAVVKIIHLMGIWKPDVLHLHMSYKGSFFRNYYLYKIARKYKIPIVIHLHGSEFERWFNQSGRMQKKKIIELLSNIECLIVLGEKWEKFIKKICPNTNTMIINNAVAIPLEKVSWNNEGINLLFMGVLIPRKGVDVLLKALKDIPASNKVRLMIVGSGKEEAELKKMARLYNIHVSFCGWMKPTELKKIILQSQVMVLPSYNEGLPMAILEAMSYGMPVIASNVGDISTAVIDGVNGMLIPPGDEAALSRSIISICNKDIFEHMSSESQKISKEKFSLDIFYKKLEDCYRKAIA